MRLKPRMGIRDDLKPVLFLLCLYFLQGVPLGLSAAIPLLLQKYGVSYTQQAVYTISIYPFSFKVKKFWRRFFRRLQTSVQNLTPEMIFVVW